MIRKVMEEKSDEIEKERQSSVFNAAVGENPESVRPEYSYNQTQKFIQECDRKIRIIKHAINCFNTTQKIGYGDMTIDEALVRVSQLTEAKKRLHDLQIRIPKERVSALGSENSSFIDYRYTNYSITEARSYYQKISYTLRNLQAALEVINVTAKVEFDLPD